MNVIGISAYFHDSACCVLRDGKLVAAAEQERFTRVKFDPSLPSAALRYCLSESGLCIADIDCVAYYEDPKKKLARQLWMGLPGLRPGLDATRKLDAGRVEREIRELFGFEGRIELVDHHLAHAASAYFFSGFSEAALLTVDGVGEWTTTAYGRASGSELELFEEVHFPDSLGLLYSTITSFLGFGVNDGEYKVMGLAPYGRPTHVDQVRALVTSEAGGQYRLEMRYFDFLRGNRMYSDELVELFGLAPRAAESEIDPIHKDIAKSLQVVLEELLIEKASYLHERVPTENLCMAGGVALNCVANGRVLREGPFKRLFVQPAANDAGGALGAAALAHVRLTGTRPDPEPMQHAYLGPAFSSEEVANVLASTPIKPHDFRGNEAGLIQATVERLAAGKVVGWFSGRMEFGPRALGARSIIADPRGPEMRDRINALVKKREAFRPFAPVVLEAKTQEHFDLDHPSPFMLETCQVRSKLDLPAITHVDGSARVQTVNPQQNARFAALLAEFDRKTGCPLLLNTSFNMRDEPIVCDPVDALTCFARSQIDALVLEDFLIDRDDLPPSWMLLRGMASGPRPGIGHDVYTFL